MVLRAHGMLALHMALDTVEAPCRVRVCDGVETNGEDHLEDIGFDTPDGAVRIKLVKPYARCPIPTSTPSPPSAVTRWAMLSSPTAQIRAWAALSPSA